MEKRPFMTVKGKPFLSLGGQTHNSSSYIYERMDPSFASIKAIGGNTMATPVPWEVFEPEEGRYDTDFVKRIIDRAREEGIHLSFLWFGTWKNGSMEYCPAWVKRDTERFPRCLQKDGTVVHQLSAFSEESMKADAKAFREFVRFLKEYDGEENTVIAVQIENEAGILGGTRRDFSPLGEAAYQAAVPEEILTYMKKNPDCYLSKIWKENGEKCGKNWAETFGYYGAEGVTAYGIARYIDEICKEGKAVYPELFMYLNVWLSGGSRGQGRNLAGISWPSGCAVIQNLDIYYATLKYIDTVAPDNYQSSLFRHREVTDAYANPEKGWPLYVPESAAGTEVNLTEMFYAIAEKGAIGYHIFGSESCLQADGVTPSISGEKIRENFLMLSNFSPLLTDPRYAGKIRSAAQEPGEDSVVLEGFTDGIFLTVSFGLQNGMWSNQDFRHRALAKETLTPGRALILQASEKVFYLVGQNSRVRFDTQAPLDGSIPNYYANDMIKETNTEYISVHEGHFDENGRFITDLVRSGDEVRHAIWLTPDIGVVRVELM